MIISDAIAMVEHDLQARKDCPENYDPDFTRALETVLKENTRLTEELLSITADRQIAINARDEAREHDADLRHEGGMYQSLYEVSQKRVEELEERLANEYDEATIAQSKLAGEIERLQALVAKREDLCGDLTKQLVKAQRALEPFVTLQHGVAGHAKDEWYRHDGDVITVSDLFYARVVFAEIAAQTDEESK